MGMARQVFVVIAMLLIAGCQRPQGFSTTESAELEPVAYSSASTLPTLTKIRLKPIGRVPWESSESDKSSTSKFVGFSVSEPVVGTDLIRYRDFATRLVFSNGGTARRIDLGTMLFRDVTLDSRGRVFEFSLPTVPKFPPPSSGVSQKRWDPFADFLQAKFNLTAVMAQLLGLLTYPDGPVKIGTPLLPRDMAELVNLIRDTIVPAAIRGGHFDFDNTFRVADEYARLDIRERTEVARIVVGKMAIHDYRGNVSVSGSAFKGGLEYLHVTGSSEITYDKELNFEKLNVTQDVLIDPFTGNIAVDKYSTRAPRRLAQELGAGGDSLTVYDLPTSVPDKVTANLLRPRPSNPQSEGSIEDIYLRSINSVFTVESGTIQGTAFLVEPGLLVTNKHVVGDNASVLLRAHDGSVFNASVVALGDGALDVALLKAFTPLNIKPLPLSRDVPTTASQIIIIGSPAGLEGTVTTGIVGGFRNVDGTNWVQVDAAINPGNSGGPILNTRGQVVGIATQRLVGEQAEYIGLNFGISSSDVLGFVRRHRGLAFLGLMKVGWFPSGYRLLYEPIELEVT